MEWIFFEVFYRESIISPSFFGILDFRHAKVNYVCVILQCLLFPNEASWRFVRCFARAMLTSRSHRLWTWRLLRCSYLVFVPLQIRLGRHVSSLSSLMYRRDIRSLYWTRTKSRVQSIYSSCTCTRKFQLNSWVTNACNLNCSSNCTSTTSETIKWCSLFTMKHQKNNSKKKKAIVKNLILKK